jgi:hypothetical protein
VLAFISSNLHESLFVAFFFARHQVHVKFTAALIVSQTLSFMKWEGNNQLKRGSCRITIVEELF